MVVLPPGVRMRRILESIGMEGREVGLAALVVAVVILISLLVVLKMRVEGLIGGEVGRLGGG